MKKVLVSIAHPDDETLGCGGTIAKHVARGDKVFCLSMTDGESARFENFKDAKLLKKKEELQLIMPLKNLVLNGLMNSVKIFPTIL